LPGLILDGIFARALEQQLVYEGLLQADVDDTEPDPGLVELCLQSILLYGPAIIFRHAKELSASRRKKLESFGLCSVEDALPNSFPFYRNQSPSKEQVLSAIAEARHLKNFITPFLRKLLGTYFGERTAFEILGMSFKQIGPYKARKVIEAIPELAIRQVFDQWDDLPYGEELDERYFPFEAAALIRQSDLIDESLIPSLLFLINEPKKLISESWNRRLPILSTVIRPRQRTVVRPTLNALDTIPVIKFALSESGLKMPRLRTTEQLLKLMDDDRVLSLRAVVKSLTGALETGQTDAIVKFQKQARDSSRALQQISKHRRILRWTFLAPVALGVAETLLGVLPSVSVVMSLGLGAADFALGRRELANQWIWLFPQKVQNK
jgi:hypothetical protein